MATPAANTGTFSIESVTKDSIILNFNGSWSINTEIPAAIQTLSKLSATKDLKKVTLRAAELTDWDASFTSYLFQLAKGLKAAEITVITDDLPEGAKRLLALALAVPERKGARRTVHNTPWLERVGQWSAGVHQSILTSLDFTGETVSAFMQMLKGKARLPRGQIGLIIQEAGPSALPIVTLISSLVGLIFAFIGALQLRQFGATIYVANLVGIAMTREMGAVMAGVIMAGRTGAAFAAQLGTMQVNEEVDALKTLGIPPIEFLVLPRMIALVVVMPLLCLYADFMGMLGGLIVSVFALDITPTQYINQTAGAVKMIDIWVGVVKSIAFGILIAGTGCMRGMQCGRSASAVGLAVTSAVVSGIVCIVVTDAVFSVLTDILGI